MGGDVGGAQWTGCYFHRQQTWGILVYKNDDFFPLYIYVWMWLIPENTRNKSAFWGFERCHEKHEFSHLFTLSFFSGFLKPGLLFAHVTFITYPYAHRDALNLIRPNQETMTTSLVSSTNSWRLTLDMSSYTCSALTSQTHVDTILNFLKSLCLHL